MVYLSCIPCSALLPHYPDVSSGNHPSICKQPTNDAKEANDDQASLHLPPRIQINKKTGVIGGRFYIIFKMAAIVLFFSGEVENHVMAFMCTFEVEAHILNCISVCLL